MRRKFLKLLGISILGILIAPYKYLYSKTKKIIFEYEGPLHYENVWKLKRDEERESYFKKLGFKWAENLFHLSYGMVDFTIWKNEK